MQSRVLEGDPTEVWERTQVVRRRADSELAIRNVAVERNVPISGVRTLQSVVLNEFADVTFATMTMLASVAAVAWVVAALI